MTKFDSGNGWAAFVSQGGRKYQQDRYRVMPWRDYLLALVADGHGDDGHLAADIACEQAPLLLEEYGFTEGREDASVPLVFQKLDERIERLCQGGTTLTLALRRPGYTLFAHVGDSEARWFDPKGVIVRATEPHHVSLVRERLWLLEQHAIVAGRRVVHVDSMTDPDSAVQMINITRSLGDRSFGKHLRAEPDLYVSLSGNEACQVVLGSDGFWSALDCLPQRDAVICEALCCHPNGVAEGIRRFHDLFPPGIFFDNATAIVVANFPHASAA